MSVLTACQNATAMLVGERPPAFFSSTDEICVEVSTIANEAAQDIIKRHEWNILTRKWSEGGDGVKTEFDLPSDYDRMCLSSVVRCGDRVLHNVANIGDWQEDEWSAGNGWIMIGGKVNVRTPTAAGTSISFMYQSNRYATDANGNPKDSFTQDTDLSRIDRRLLTLGIIWKWRALKRQDYQEDMQNYEIAMSDAMARDGGSRVYSTGDRISGNLSTPWPWSLG